MEKVNRKRYIQFIVRMMQEEKDLIYQKIAQIPTKNLAAYARKMLTDGYIIHVDYTDIKNHAAQLGRIGGNINHIVKRMNQTGGLYRDDVEEIKRILAEIWKSERHLMLKMR